MHYRNTFMNTQASCSRLRLAKKGAEASFSAGGRASRRRDPHPASVAHPSVG